MTLQQLQYVVALDNHRHFVKAAESCFVAQPTLTLQVKKLEDQIGMLIFDRSKQPVEPTPMGEVFIAKSRQILRDIDQLKEMINDYRDNVEGTFTVGIIPSLSTYILPLLLPELAVDYPDTKLEILELQSEQIMDRLKNGMLHVGILVTPLQEDELREVPLFYEPFLVYADEGNALLSQKELMTDHLGSEGLWVLEQGHCFRNQTLNICGQARRSKNKNIKFESGSIETLKRLIDKIGGYTLIPELSYNSKSEEKNIRRFKEPQPAREVSVVVHKSFTKEGLLTALRKSMLKTIPSGFKKNTRFVTVRWR